jgi:hypothetical protein
VTKMIGFCGMEPSEILELYFRWRAYHGDAGHAIVSESGPDW